MSNDHADKHIDAAAIVAMVQNGSIEREDLMELCRFVSDAFREPVVIQDPAPDQMIYYTINPDPPSLAERLQENREREKLEALTAKFERGIKAMVGIEDSKGTSAREIVRAFGRDMSSKGTTDEWVTIPYTGNVGQSERLFDPG